MNPRHSLAMTSDAMTEAPKPLVRRSPHRGLMIAGLTAALLLSACGKKDQQAGGPGGC